MKKLSLRLDDERHAKLKKLAEKDNRSMHNMIIVILDRFFEQAEEEEKQKQG